MDPHSIPSFQGWEIITINQDRFDRRVDVVLYLPVAGMRATLHLYGVDVFYVSTLAMQNVVEELLIYDEPDITEAFDHGCRLVKRQADDFNEHSRLKLLYIRAADNAELACSFNNCQFSELSNHLMSDCIPVAAIRRPEPA